MTEDLQIFEESLEACISRINKVRETKPAFAHALVEEGIARFKQCLTKLNESLPDSNIISKEGPIPATTVHVEEAVVEYATQPDGVIKSETADSSNSELEKRIAAAWAAIEPADRASSAEIKRLAILYFVKQSWVNASKLSASLYATFKLDIRPTVLTTMLNEYAGKGPHGQLVAKGQKRGEFRAGPHAKQEFEYLVGKHLSGI